MVKFDIDINFIKKTPGLSTNQINKLYIQYFKQKMCKISKKDLCQFLEEKYIKYHNTNFIEKDPILVPHQFKILQDVEISGFFAAIFAWGKRSIIINKALTLMNYMDNSPYDFIKNHTKADLKILENFKHRTFNFIDLKYFCNFLKKYYKKNQSLQYAFVKKTNSFSNFSIEISLNNFYNQIFTKEALSRTRRHLSCPFKKSLCKRINMFLRWMTRKGPVDFGIWNQIPISKLILPCDVHVLRISKKLGLLKQNTKNWKTALQLTQNLQQFSKEDPVKYDFALFGYGVEEFKLLNELN